MNISLISTRNFLFFSSYIFIFIVTSSSCSMIYNSASVRDKLINKIPESEQSYKLETEGDSYFFKRESKDKLKTALSIWKTAARLSPSARIYVKLARGHYFLGDAFYGLKNDYKKRDKNFIIGLDFAMKSLRYSAPKVMKEVDSGVKFYKAIRNAPKEAVPSMYWYSTCLCSWAASKGFITCLRYKDDIKSIIDTLKSLDQNYFFAGPIRYSAIYQAITAGLAGGSLDKSKSYFLQAMKLAPDYFATKVLCAKYLATKIKNYNIFKKLLNEVLMADPEINPLIIPENKAEQIKAKQLLLDIEKYFLNMK